MREARQQGRAEPGSISCSFVPAARITITNPDRIVNRGAEVCQRQVEMSYSLPSRNVRLRPAGWRGGGRVVAVGGRVAPVLRARGRSDGAGSEASG